MPVTYAGVALVPPVSPWDDVARWWGGGRVESMESAYLLPAVGNLPIPAPPPDDPPRVGVLRWPAAPNDWATCHAVATGPQLAAVRAALGQNPSAQPLKFDDGNFAVTCFMYLAAARPISQRGDGGEMYLLSLVDQRYFWWASGAASAPTAAASWAALLTGLYAPLGVSPTVPPVPAAYLTPNMTRWGLGVQPLPLMISAAAYTVGLRPVSTRSGTLLQTYTQAKTADDARWAKVGDTRLGGGRLYSTDVAVGLPAAVDVYFADGTATPVTLASLGFTALAGVAGVATRKGLIVADPAAPTAAQKTALATQAATDYYSWAFGITDCTLRGFQDVEACGLDAAVEWAFTPDGPVTRIFRGPLSDRNVYGMTAAGPPTTTTTTAAPCPGACGWAYTAASKTWAKTSSACGAGCSCQAPTFCPSGDACATTGCGHTLTDQIPPYCGGSTTTAGPCSGSCTWQCQPTGIDNYGYGRYTWQNVANTCGAGCECDTHPLPTDTNGDCRSTSTGGNDGSVPPCGFLTRQCFGTTIGPGGPGGPCSGTCDWVWASSTVSTVNSEWVLARSGCAGTGNCLCDEPSYNGSTCGDQTRTYCYNHGYGGGGGGPTPAPGPGCSGTCLWGTTNGTTWNNILRSCPGCACAQPPALPTATCSQAEAPCQTPPTTAAPTTTTTTTTAAPCSGSCTYTCGSGGVFVYSSGQCAGPAPCGCAGSPGANNTPVGCAPGGMVYTACCQVAYCNNGTTTTGAPVTTTARATTGDVHAE